MHIEVSTDNSINGSESLTSQIAAVVQHELLRLQEHITRIEVHLSDNNAAKSGPGDIHCMLEARIKGQQPVVSKHAAETLEKAAKGAASKLKHVLETIVGRISDRRRSVSETRPFDEINPKQQETE